ncbi:ABC transporter related protein [Thermoplasma acidophilum]|uniref:ABC transporter related protein n=1 Tax=Thermoplasma acidophilum (strain ATCC 25905 / DSM 1728 / JCM 9062 / NBRC 15155 / AMRC-C165) TaxID=273075 RepID=Q9HJU8_THEAC|nr:AarF/ABC1/UbiB kinase family protein [Thermoplasma acidophilum]CAC11994.1 ABC transporter related protein [Thermoplasma acidophilum]
MKYGFLEKLYPVFRRYLKDRKHEREDHEWDYEIERHGEIAVRRFIELGPTFIKLGQILSARPDLLPKEYLKSFRLLQDRVDPDPFPLAREIIERNVGKIEDVFEYFNENAISGASLGQVYEAVYHGKKVAVKVNRYNIEERVRNDLIVIKHLLRLAKGRIDNFLYLSIENVVSDFNRRIFDEIDYRKEASNMRAIAANLKEEDRVIVPGIIEELSGKEVLVMEYIEGIKIDDVQRLKDAGLDTKEIALRYDTIFMRMLLKNEIFHADPHPGNVSVREDGSIILYDFGMIGHINDDMRFRLLSLYDGLLNRDPDEIIDALIALNALSPGANRGVIRKGIELAISNFYGRSAEDLEIRELLDVANDVIFQFPFRLPRALVLYMRMSSLLEGVCQQLDPDFKFIRVLQKLLYDEGLIQTLYKQQLKNFLSDTLRSVEKAVQIVPLMKRRLESEDETVRPQRDYRIPASIFLGFILLSLFIEEKTRPLVFIPLIAIDIVAFLYIMIRK